MLHRVIPSILVILGYVSAAQAQDCAEFVELLVLDPASQDNALKKFDGLYQVTDEEKDGKPVYRNEGDTSLCIFFVPTSLSDGRTALGDCQNKIVWYMVDAGETCYEPDLNNTFAVGEMFSGAKVVSLKSVVRGASCSECREILSGDLKGNYNLVDRHSPHCNEAGEDGCLYKNTDNGNTVCFKEDAAGTDTMLHDETCAP